MRHSFIKLFHLPNLLQMLDGHRVVDTELFSNFSCSCERITFDGGSQFVVVNFWELATVLLIFKALTSLAKHLEPSLHCTFVSSSWAKYIAELSSLLCDPFWTQIRKLLEFALCLTLFPFSKVNIKHTISNIISKKKLSEKCASKWCTT